MGLEFYKNIGKNLMVLNFISITFLILTIFGYSIIQYLIYPLVDMTFSLFSNVDSQNLLLRILEFGLLIPNFFDISFFMFFLVIVFDVFVFAWKTEKQDLFWAIIFSLIGLPIWLIFLSFLETAKDWALNFLMFGMTNTINMPFYGFIQSYSLELTLLVFIMAISINVIDWGNLKIFDKLGKKITPTSTQEQETLQELLKQ